MKKQAEENNRKPGRTLYNASKNENHVLSF